MKTDLVQTYMKNIKLTKTSKSARKLEATHTNLQTFLKQKSSLKQEIESQKSQLEETLKSTRSIVQKMAASTSRTSALASLGTTAASVAMAGVGLGPSVEMVKA